MADQSGSSGSGKPAQTKLQAAFDRAKAAKKPLDKKKGGVESPHILHNVRRHKLAQALTPTGHLRRQPDAELFRYYEIKDRSEAIQRRQSRGKDVNSEKNNKNKDSEIER